MDDETAARIFGAPDDLAPHHRAAVALADALMTQPSALSDDEVAELRRHFTESQLVELTLDVMKWNYQKVSVATGTDVELVPGTLAELRFDDDGHFIRPE